MVTSVLQPAQNYITSHADHCLFQRWSLWPVVQHQHIGLHQLEDQRVSVHWAIGIEHVLHMLTLIHMRCSVGR